MINQKAREFAVEATATRVGTPSDMHVTLYNSGEITLYVNLGGNDAATTGIGNIPIPPGDSLPLPPLGVDQISAISRVAGGRLTVIGSQEPPSTTPTRSRVDRVTGSFAATTVNDADLVAYNIAADFIVTGTGHAVRALTLRCSTNPMNVRFDAGVSAPGAATTQDIQMAPGEELEFDDLELIEGIHIRNDGAAANGTVEGEVKGA